MEGRKGKRMDKKKIIIPVLALALVAGGAFAATKVWASNNGNGISMAKGLAEKLGIEESKVTNAMTEVQTEEQQSRLSESLDKAVSEEVITTEQKQKVIDKQNEITEKQKALNEEMKTWASDNGIDITELQKYLTGFGNGEKNGRGPGGPGNYNTPANQ